MDKLSEALEGLRAALARYTALQSKSVAASFTEARSRPAQQPGSIIAAPWLRKSEPTERKPWDLSSWLKR